jgi:hypothetical protein
MLTRSNQASWLQLGRLTQSHLIGLETFRFNQFSKRLDWTLKYSFTLDRVWLPGWLQLLKYRPWKWWGSRRCWWGSTVKWTCLFEEIVQLQHTSSFTWVAIQLHIFPGEPIHPDSSIARERCETIRDARDVWFEEIPQPDYGEVFLNLKQGWR